MSQFVSTDKWLDHLEDEAEPAWPSAEAQDLALLLKNSRADSQEFETLKRVRAQIKASDDIALPESGRYYEELQTQIMAKIMAEGAVESLAESQLEMNAENDEGLISNRFFNRQNSKGYAGRSGVVSRLFGAAVLTMMVALLVVVGLRDHSNMRSTQTSRKAQADVTTNENFDRKIAMVDSRAGARFARDMGSFESEEDFLTDSAAAWLKQVSVQQAEAMIRSLKR